jgi:hypothetical protein
LFVADPKSMVSLMRENGVHVLIVEVARRSQLQPLGAYGNKWYFVVVEPAGSKYSYASASLDSGDRAGRPEWRSLPKGRSGCAP